MDGRTTEPAYTISSPGAFGSGELKFSHHLGTVSKWVRGWWAGASEAVNWGLGVEGGGKGA